MGQENVQHTGEVIFARIEKKFGSDAAFERAANLAPKTVNNWRRGRSSSYMIMLPELAAVLGVPVGDLLGGEEASGIAALTAEEQEFLTLFRSTGALRADERAALNATIRNAIDLYLSTRTPGEHK